MDAILQQKPKRKLMSGLDNDDNEDEHYDPVVASAMEELQAKKRAKLGSNRKGFTKAKKGLTLEEVEEQEGGVVKESKLGMAATRRAQRRKKGGADDETELLAVDEMVEAEEALEKNEEEGMTLEPFNLEQERQEGHFDDSGNYVENKEEEDPTMQDAWLTSDAKLVSEEVRRKVEAENARRTAVETAPEMTALQAANLMRDIISNLLPGETVNKALRRLRPAPPGQPKQAKRSSHADKQTAGPSSQGDNQNKQRFDELTEAAMTLLDAGELDIYSMPKEDLEEKAGRHPAEADDFDMFGEPNPTSSAPQQSQAEQAGRTQDSNQTTITNGIEEAVEEAAVDYSTWPVKELARFLRERGVDPAGIIEKEDLVAKVAEIAAKGPEGEAEDEPSNAPEGYGWDSASSYYYNAAAGMYYDANSGSYFSATDGQWYTLDSNTSQFVKMVS